MSRFILLWPAFLLLIASCAQPLQKGMGTGIDNGQPQNKTGQAPDTLASDSTSEINQEALRYFMDGQLYMNQGDYARAVIELQDALELNPEVSTIHVSLAECYWRLGKIKRSFRHLQKAIEIDPQDTEAREILANQYIMQRKYEKAEEQYRILSQIEPDNPEYIYALGDLAKVRQNYSQAMEYYIKTYELDPKAIKALEDAAQMALSTKQFDIAKDLYKKLIDADENNVKYLKMYSNIVLLNGDLQQAIWAQKQIVKLMGPDVDVFNQIGAMYYEIDKPDSALFYFLEAVDLDSTNLETLNYLSTVYREQENYDLAADYAEKIITYYPDKPQGYVDAALVALNQEKYADAIAILSGPAEKFKDDYVIQKLLGTSYNLEKNMELAEVYLKRTVELRPDDRGAWHSLAIIYDTSKRWEESDRIYNRLIEEDSTDAQAYNNYAYSLAERGEKIEYALELAKTAIRLAPDNSAYLDTIGWIYYKLGENEKALSLIRQSVEIEDTNPVVLEHLGDVLTKLKRYDEAQQYYQKALELDQDNERLKLKIANK